MKVDLISSQRAPATFIDSYQAPIFSKLLEIIILTNAQDFCSQVGLYQK